MTIHDLAAVAGVVMLMADPPMGPKLSKSSTRNGAAVRNIVACTFLWLLATVSSAVAAPTSARSAGSGAIEQAEVFRPHDVLLRAKVSGNPYLVHLAGELRGSEGAILRIPGFHDGGDRWIVRLSAPRPGAWTLRTISNVPALDGHVRTINARPSSSAMAHGVLQIDPEHPRHFRFQDGTRFFPMGYEADWLWGVDMTDPKRRLMHRLIEQMDGRGFNYVLVNVYAHDTRWAPGKSCDWDFGPPALYAFGGTNDHPDHTRLNAAFFQAYDHMMWRLWERGIVAHIMIKVYNKRVKWPDPGSAEEKRYFQYIVARYQAFPNIVWDFSKESYNEKDDRLQHNILGLIRKEDAYGHLVTLHDDTSFLWNEALGRDIDFQTHQIHSHYEATTAFARALYGRPVLNAEFGYELGVEKLPTHAHADRSEWRPFLQRAWTLTLAGSYPVYYYDNTAWDVVKPDPEPPGMARWKLLKDTLSALPYWQTKPHNELATGGICLASPGTAYVFYVTGDKVTTNLRHLEGRATATWVDTWTGQRVEAGTPARGVHVFPRPPAFGEAPAVLIVRSANPRIIRSPHEPGRRVR